MLAEALTTHGKALARLAQFEAAKTSLDQAMAIAQRAGDPDRSGIAALSAIEELGKEVPSDILLQYYRTAESMLTNSQNRGLKVRLGDCARLVLASDST